MTALLPQQQLVLELLRMSGEIAVTEQQFEYQLLLRKQGGHEVSGSAVEGMR